MEQYIPLIIFAIIGALASAKKKKPEQANGQPKPFTANGRIPGNPVKKLQELSKEMYDELQKEFQDVPSEPPSRQTIPQATVQHAARKPVVAQSVQEEISTPVQSRFPRVREAHRGRLSAHGGRIETQSDGKKNNLLPKDRHDLLKGIVFSEILSPPKSKQ